MHVIVHPSLRPLHAHLQAIRRCLLEMGKHGPWLAAEVMRWKLILKQIDDKRVHGIYIGEPQANKSTHTLQQHGRFAILERMKFWKSMVRRNGGSPAVPDSVAEMVEEENTMMTGDGDLAAQTGLRSNTDADINTNTSAEAGSSWPTAPYPGPPSSVSSVQEGQALLHALWNECYDLVLELEAQVEAQVEDEETAALAEKERLSEMRSYRPIPVATFRPVHYNGNASESDKQQQ